MCWMIETAAHRSAARAKIEMVKSIRMSLGKNSKACRARRAVYFKTGKEEAELMKDGRMSFATRLRGL
jgi:hypothetical protein